VPACAGFQRLLFEKMGRASSYIGKHENMLSAGVSAREQKSACATGPKNKRRELELGSSFLGAEA